MNLRKRKKIIDALTAKGHWWHIPGHYVNKPDVPYIWYRQRIPYRPALGRSGKVL